ncbi:MAG TPA: hypothetical protein VMJ64_14405 [Anaerolineales bacterium]|nr:hypothetical protein [Anaerolineales bacterium]
MGEKQEKRKLAGPWGNLHTAVWLIGLAIIALKGWWWPGILVLIAISLVVEALLKMFAPQAFEAETTAGPVSPVTASPVEPVVPAPLPEHRAELLPEVCPRCGGPLKGHEVRWTGPQSADCPYCGSNLPMARG